MQNDWQNNRNLSRDYARETARENILTLGFVATTWILFAVLIAGDLS
jgi:hypothetical protein